MNHPVITNPTPADIAARLRALYEQAVMNHLKSLTTHRGQNYWRGQMDAHAEALTGLCGITPEQLVEWKNTLTEVHQATMQVEQDAERNSERHKVVEFVTGRHRDEAFRFCRQKNIQTRDVAHGTQVSRAPSDTLSQRLTMYVEDDRITYAHWG